MKKIYLLVIVALILFAGCGDVKDAGYLSDGEETLLHRRLDEAMLRYRAILEEYTDSTKIPYTVKDGQISGVQPSSWVSGFFPGTMWYLYEYSGEEFWREKAEHYTTMLEDQQYNRGTHDLGFMMYCSYGNGYRLDEKPEYKKVLMNSAESLCSRYSEKTGVIRSWDFAGWWEEYPVIIDNMMNLELLMWAARESGDEKYKDIALDHTQNTMEEHYRDDYSCYHVVDYDTINGKVLGRGTLQGYSDSSSWARGQAWGLYGFTMMCRETGDEDFLGFTEKVAGYLISQMGEDPVPLWDYSVPDPAVEENDASAGAIQASAYIQLYELTGDEKYVDAAKALLLRLSAEDYFASSNENGGFLLKHSVGYKPAGLGIDVPLSYTDYYYVEALINLLKIENEG